MTYPITLAEWDSRFFGFPIGNIELPADYSAAELEAVLREAHSKYRLLALTILGEGPDTVTFSGSRCACYARRISFKKDIPQNVMPPDSRVRAYTSTFCSPALERLAVQSGILTRFRMDPELAPHFERLFVTWMNFAVTKELADSIWTWYENGHHLGLVTIRSAKRISPGTSQVEKEGRIGMLSVDAEHRRRGIGKTLFDACDFWCSSLGIPVSAIIVQKENEPVISLCQSIGFKQDKEDSIYHYWSPGWVYDAHHGWITAKHAANA